MSKATFAASIQAKSGRLYAVIQVKTGKATKPVWRALGLDEGTPKSTINKRFREVVTNFEEEYEELLERAERFIESKSTVFLTLSKPSKDMRELYSLSANLPPFGLLPNSALPFINHTRSSSPSIFTIV